VIDWFLSLPIPLQIVVAWLALCAVGGIVLGVAQATGLLPKGWTAERFRALFDRNPPDDHPDDREDPPHPS
jgi:hypothetical protein